MQWVGAFAKSNARRFGEARQASAKVEVWAEISFHPEKIRFVGFEVHGGPMQ